jgi:cytochrome bd-type quinol oxidase subunit 1
MGSQLVCYAYARRKVVREVVKMHLVRRPLPFYVWVTGWLVTETRKGR